MLLSVASVLSAQSRVVPIKDSVDRPLECAIIGASLSAGFVDGPLTGGETSNRTIPLQTVVRGWLRDVDARVRTVADLSMFMAPDKKGAAQVERSLRREPDLVVGGAGVFARFSQECTTFLAIFARMHHFL